MKQQGKASKTTLKPRFSDFGFWFPILFSAVNVIVIAIGLAILSTTRRSDSIELTVGMNIILKLFYGFVVLGPSFMIAFSFIMRRHKGKYPKAPSYYRVMPGMLSVMVSRVDILILVLIAGNR